MRINNNIPALTAFNALTANTNSLQKVIKQVSTGLRINSAADDAAGLAISENMRAQSSGLERAMMNAQDGISLLQTAEGALGETNSMLQRMRELAVQAANDTLTSQDRSYLQMEIDELKANINNIAGNTQFNTKRLLDGSCCGTWTSTDTGTKAYIRGKIEAEGNYRIEVKADPGEAQVQKSNIFRIKHENTITNTQLNADNGIGKVEVDGVPAGNYNITATLPGGGLTTTTYVSQLTGTVSEGNTSTFSETMELTFTNESGDTGIFTVNLAETDTTKELVSAAIARQLNGQTITVGEEAYVLDVKDNGSGTYTVTSEGNVSGLTKITSAKPVVNSEVTAKVSASASYDATDTMYVETLHGTVQKDLETGDAPASITFTFTNASGNSGTYTVSGIPAGNASSVASYISSQLHGKTVDIGGTNELIQCSANGTGYNIVTSTGDKDKRILSVSTDNPSLAGSFSRSETSNFNHVVSTISGNVVKPNTNSVNERITLTFHDKSSSTEYADPVTKEAYNADTIGAYHDVYSDGTEIWYKYSKNDSIELEIEPGLTESEIAAKIQEAVAAKGSLTFSDQDPAKTKNINIAAVSSDKSYTITTDEYACSSYWSTIDVICNVTLSVEPSGSTSASSDDGYPQPTDYTEPAATTSLTGFYGDEEAAQSLSVDVNLDTQNNASILFEVVASAFDEELETGTLTLSAQSHVLTTDGQTAYHSNSKIVFSTSDSSAVDISSLLGEDSGALSLSLDPAKFKIGDKFVYNVSGNGTHLTPADASLYVNGSQDSSWPESWGNKDYVTYNNNRLYFNVNADAVSNRELHLRNYYLNSENGKVHDGEITLTLNEDFGVKATDFPPAPSGDNEDNEADELMLGSFTANYVGKIAEGGTRLRDIEQFWNTQTGVFMLETPQVITVSQNDGRSASITLDASDTINDLRRKFNEAVSEGLGQGLYTSGGNSNNFVTFVEKPSENGIETVKGTMVFRSVIPGAAGELTFTSINGELIDALGLNTIQAAQDTSYTASVYNAHTGSVIAQNVKTEGNILHGVIDKNIDVEFGAMSGVKAVWSDKDKNFMLEPEDGTAESFLHIVKNDITFQTGASTGENITLDIGDMSASGLGVGGINIMTRDRASEAISTLDAAIRQVSSQRTKIGSYQNELERTIETLTVNNTNLINAESRIRDADMSKSVMDLVKYQIIHQSGTAMLGQANQLPQAVLGLLQ